MEAALNNFLSDYEIFLNKIKPTVKNEFKGKIINFVYPLNTSINPDTYFKILYNFPQAFYFCNKSIKFIGYGICTEFKESGKNRFDAFDKRLKEGKSKIFSNANDLNICLPLIVGGMKFTPDNEENEWKDFADSDWFIPTFLLVEKDSKSYLIHNTNSLALDKTTFNFGLLSKTLNQEIKDNRNTKIKSMMGNTPKDKKKWKLAVDQVKNRIVEQELKKVVLSRRVEILLEEPVSLKNIISELENEYSECTVFCYKKENTAFFGATPELLIEFNGNKIESEALAGSIKNVSEENSLDISEELLKSFKNLEEHKIVVEFISSILKKYCSEVHFEQTPVLKNLKNIQHLNTKITAKMNNDLQMFRLIGELHPTPAMGGMPKENAIILIKKLEDFERGFYSGIIGWFNQNNFGEFYAAIRSALSNKNKVYAYAGCGIVEESDPEQEYQESDLKLQPIMALFK